MRSQYKSRNIFKMFRMRINLRNLIIQLRQEIVSTLVESTKSTRAFCAVLTLFYLISRKFIKNHQVLGQHEDQNFKLSLVIYGDSIDTFIGITPGKLIGPNFNIWTLVTHCFVGKCSNFSFWPFIGCNKALFWTWKRKFNHHDDSGLYGYSWFITATWASLGSTWIRNIFWNVIWHYLVSGPNR